ncbi:hypothetical protein [Paenibacillus sp. Marseille-Q4541]|uniref:hypothetical protein n=1 Tax=Paenibacillus sp. Marseille-Q4541 TaxID=2831522 RepID=UPI001BA61A2C|nr:hypothetical protein [Paenibacillus sp. Marseille-Q4541]
MHKMCFTGAVVGLYYATGNGQAARLQASAGPSMGFRLPALAAEATSLTVFSNIEEGNHGPFASRGPIEGII